MTENKGNYADVNGLQMYYEIHGSGEPLLVLHGAYMNIDAMGEFVPTLARTRRVIAVELQAHGRTADVDRPLTYEQMADDAAALLRHLGIESADVFGYSMGGGVALQVAIRHPELVRKLVAASATFNTGGAYPEMFEMIETITPELFAGSPRKDEYDRIAPDPKAFPKLVEKLKQLSLTPRDWPPEAIRGIPAPTLVVIGDSDTTRPEHAVEMFRLLGGGVMGDLAGLPRARLAVLPATSHLGVLERVDWLVPMIVEFLDAPILENDTSEKDSPTSSDEPENDLPSGLGKPAQRALAGAGYARLEQLTEVSEAEILGLHGMGPKAMERLRSALAARGLSFAGEEGR